MTTEPNNLEIRDGRSRKSKKPTSAASTVAQAKAKTERNGKIESITQTRIEHGFVPETDQATMTAIFPRNGGREPHHVDLNFLLDFPNLQSMFAEAFLCWGAVVSPNTRLGCRDSLRRHFFGYLKSAWSNTLHPKDIDDEVLAGFRYSLLTKPGNRGKTLHPTTVNAALGDLRAILAALTVGPWRKDASRISELTPSGPAGADRKAEPTEVLGLEHLLAIIEAAEREIATIQQRFMTARNLLAEGRTRLTNSVRVIGSSRYDYSDFATCLAAVDEAYPGVVPKQRLVQLKFPALGAALKNIHGLSSIESHLYPSCRDLVAFVLLLGVTTVFNAETILNLNWRDIDLSKEQAGTPAIEIVGSKGRATRDLVRLLDPDTGISSQLSLKHILDSLQKITLRIRPHLGTRDADCLFVYVTRNGARRAKGFGFDNEKRVVLRSSDLIWSQALTNFIKDNALSPFTLNQLRPSILDLVQFMDGSLEAAQKVGNHGSPATTWTHYTSGGVKARYRERIGQVIMLRERWIHTNGAIDPRRLTLEQDKGAATPGFSCLDPFDSPRPNQQRGKLCKDYGGCPSCPQSAAHPSDPLCVAYYTALEVAIYRSQKTMSARTWVERWAPILADLAALNTWIHPRVLEASREISIKLPNVG